MQTLKRAAAVLIYPAILCLSVACDRAADRTPTSPGARPRADVLGATTQDATEWLTRALSLGELLFDDPRMTAWTDEVEDDDQDPITVVPFEFDPFHTHLVRARWLRGTGCPTNATINTGAPGMFTDDACPMGDPKDSPGRNEGLLLVKTGPTPNIASAGASFKGLPSGTTLTDLGYDIRTGSHCGAGAPRFNVVTTDGVLHFVGCSSTETPPVITNSSAGWKRLRWFAVAGCIVGAPTPICSPVKSIAIVFDEGQDTPSAGPPGPETGSGLAVLDNIDVNGTMVGRGPGN